MLTDILNAVESAVEQFSQQYGAHAVAVFARKKGLEGFARNVGAQEFVALESLPVDFDNVAEIEIRVFGGIRTELQTHSLEQMVEALNAPVTVPRLFLVPSYFPWEQKTELPIVVREPLQEKRFVIPVPAKAQKSSPRGKFEFDQKEFLRLLTAIVQINTRMCEGQCYLMNLTTKIAHPKAKVGFDALRFLRSYTKDPARFGAFLRADNNGCMAFSPERFVAIRNGWIFAEPIKGTLAAKGKTEPTFADAQALWGTKKEIYEHTMVVDLLRNDLNAVCEPGSVGVWRPFFAGIAGNLLQMQSTVVGKLSQPAGLGNVLRAILPGGSVTGTPKWRVCEFTQQFENERRGYYTGIFGVADADGSVDTALLIRSWFLENGSASAGVGAGITVLSSPTAEIHEFQLKLGSFLGRLS